MLSLPRLAYEAPDRMDDLLALAAEPGVRVLAGGTDLLPSLKYRVLDAAGLVSLRRLPRLRAIVEEPDGGLSIGAAATLRDVRRHPAVRARYPALADACATVATATIQAMGTIGGNLLLDTRCTYYNQPELWRRSLGGCLKRDGEVCRVAPRGRGCVAAHSADTVPVLWLYGARVELASREGVRELAVSELYDGADGRRWLRTRPGEVLTRVRLPPPGEAHVVHRKVRLRGAIDYPLLLVAVRRDAGPGAAAVVSAVGPAPVEVRADRAEDLPELAWRTVRPLPTHAASTTWRRHMVRVEARRALEALG